MESRKADASEEDNPVEDLRAPSTWTAIPLVMSLGASRTHDLLLVIPETREDVSLPKKLSGKTSQHGVYAGDAVAAQLLWVISAKEPVKLLKVSMNI